MEISGEKFVRKRVQIQDDTKEIEDSDKQELEAFARRIKVIETNFTRPKRSSIIVPNGHFVDKRCARRGSVTFDEIPVEIEGEEGQLNEGKALESSDDEIVCEYELNESRLAKLHALKLDLDMNPVQLLGKNPNEKFKKESEDDTQATTSKQHKIAINP